MRKLLSITSLTAALIMPLTASSYESGSTGADGTFNPTADTQLTLPPSGIFNFTDVVIPEGVTVTFAKNASNTPVYILVTGDVTIDGTISVSGGRGGGSGNGTPGVGGPGGFNGGKGGLRSSTGGLSRKGGNGLGPGAGQGGGTGSSNIYNNNDASGGGYGTQGDAGDGVPGGSTYGSSTLATMIGGSGGGGAGGYNHVGPGGGGGGGAILIASSGTVTVNGSITAIGGNAGQSSSFENRGGAGSGGAIRISATTIQGEGIINALGGSNNPKGGNGYIRLQAENMLRNAKTTPDYKFSVPAPAFYPALPSVKITSIGSESVGTNPTGFRDIILPGVTTNPVAVEFETTNVPLGTTITLTVNPERGGDAIVSSTPISGSETLGTASAEVELPSGNSTLFGYASFTLSLASAEQAAAYSQYAKGEQVEKVRVDVDTNGQSETTFITISGNEYSWPSNQVELALN